MVSRIWLLLLVMSVSLPAATYEVAPRNPAAADDNPGTSERPWKTLRVAAGKVRAGDLVILRGGIYREHAVVEANGTREKPICFEAAPGEHVVLTGADLLTQWEQMDAKRPVYRTAWPHRFITWNSQMTHPNDPYHRVIGRCEQVVVSGYPLSQVLSADQLAPGSFFADVTNQALLVWDSADRELPKLQVEAAVRQEIFRATGDHIQIRGLRFQYAANMAQHGAVVLAGKYNVMEDCVVEGMNSSGATITGQHAVVRRCVFRDNGQLGFSASRAHHLLFTGCVVENNNVKGFDRGWEAGGDKLVLCRDAVLEHSRFVRNRGCGVWFDIGNTNCTVRHCVIADNGDAGIFYEISFGLHAHDNVIVGNGFASTAGAWGAQAGISLSSSPWCVIERNVIAGNREGFNFREQLRTTPTIEDSAERPVWNHDQVIRGNVIAYNRDAQVWGWFDVKDNRHWPAGTPSVNQLPSSSAPPADIAAPYGAKAHDRQPAGLHLAELHFRFEENLYFANPGQGWFAWGPTWARHEVYGALADFQTALGIDQGSRTVNPGLANLYRLKPREIPELIKQANR